MELNTELRKRILKQNEGFTTRMQCEGSNFRAEKIYTIVNGELHVREVGRNFLVDSRYDKEVVEDDNNTYKFLFEYKGKLNFDGVE